ncbi:MAG: RecB-like helicase [Campylobacterota bacterium]
MKNYLALKASAGSGKTFSLTVRYITLLLYEAKPEDILTLTFTNKAANEMSERIYNTLLTLGDDEAYLNAISKQSLMSKEEILGKKSYLLKNFSNSSLAIFTIDKFINKILREFCGYVGVMDDFEIKEDDEQMLSMKFLQSLNQEQFDILVDFSIYENRKFNSLFELFKTLLEKNETIDIVNIDAKLIDLQKKEVLKSAFKIKEGILSCKSASNAAKKAVSFEKFDELFKTTWLQKDTLSDYSYFKKCSDDILENYFYDLKNDLTNYYKLRAGYSLSKLYELFLMFKEFKLSYNKSKNYLEFNDISNLVYDLLTNKIDKEFLYFRLDSQYSHILIDEFQDTSLIQYKILEPLIQEILSGDEKKFRTFFYVGDTKQSIYRFRGGKRELFDYVANTNSLLEVEVLNTNFRTTSNILDFVNSVFLNLPNYEYYEQKSMNQGGYVEVVEDEALDDKDFKTVASKVAYLMQNGVNSNDIAILTYTNDDVLTLYYYLKEKFPTLKITTEMTSKLINQENVKALINAIKYLYFKESIYKENLNAIVGNKLTTSFDLKVDLEHSSVRSIVKQIASNLKLIDENIIRFIEACTKYENIVDFVYEVDSLDTSISNSETLGLQILTVFKSKGLEFNTVLLLDRIKRKVPNKSSLLFEYDSVNLKNIFYKIKGFENYDKNYANALNKEKSLALEDEINILYVALTRAKNNLLIFKKQKSSVFDILDLKKLKIGELVSSTNTSKNYEVVIKVDYKPLDLGTQEKQLSKQKDINEQRLYSKYFGIATHFCLEMMDEFTIKSLENSIVLAKNSYSNYLDKKDFEKIKNRITTLIKDKEFNSFIQDSIYTSEQSIMYNNEIKIIDLLVQKRDRYYIFDYKTTKKPSIEHENQVKEYKKAIKTIFDTHEVYSYILYLKDEYVDIIEVD